MDVQVNVWKGALLGLAVMLAGLGACAAQDGYAQEKGQCYLLKIEGMTCKDCAHHVQKALSAVRGVAEASVDFAKAEAIVCTRSGVPVTGDKLLAAVAKAGYKATIKRRK